MGLSFQASNALRKGKRSLAFLSHQKLRQLIRRSTLLLKRRVQERTARFGSHSRSEESDHASYDFDFLHLSRRLSFPSGWHRPAFRGQEQLWGMNLHYMRYLTTFDDQDFIDLVRGWIRSNPPFHENFWLYSWNAYSLSIRAVVWMQESERRTLPADFLKETDASLAQQLRFLTSNVETDVLGNHLVKNIRALLWGGLYFSGNGVEAWRALGSQLLERELDEQVLPDGMHYERSHSYHTQVMVDLLEVFQILPDGTLKQRLNTALRGMAHATADLTHPDGGPALFNDAGLTMADPPGGCLDLCGKLLDHRPQPRRHVALTEAGYYGFRSEGDFFLVDCGAIAPDFLMAHGHGDILSFEWTVAGHRLIVDQGVFEYNAGPRREASRSTASHNTVTVGDGEQADFFGSFRCGRRSRGTVLRYEPREDGFVLEGTHDGFHYLPGRPCHVREFDITAREIRIWDRVEGGAGQPVIARFLIHPDWRVECQGDTALLTRDGVTIRVTASCDIVAVPAVWWPDMGLALDTQRLIVTYGAAPCDGRVSLRRVGSRIAETNQER